MLVIETKTPRLRRGFIVKATLAGGLAAATSIFAAAGLHLALAPAPLAVHYTHRPLPAEAKPRRTFALNGNPTAARFFGPNRAAVLEGQAVGVVDLVTGAVTDFEPKMLGEIRAMDVVGERIALGDASGGVGVYEHGVWKFLEVDGPVRSIALGPDGKWLVATTVRGAAIHCRIGNLDRPSEPVTHHVEAVSRVAFAGPETVLLLGNTFSEVWDLESGAITHLGALTLGSSASPNAIAATRDGMFALPGDEGIELYEVGRFSKSNQVLSLRTLRRHAPHGETAALRFTQDGGLLVTAGSCDPRIRIFRAADGVEVVDFLPYGRVRDIDVSGHEILVASGVHDSLELWDLEKRDEIPFPR